MRMDDLPVDLPTNGDQLENGGMVHLSVAADCFRGQ